MKYLILALSFSFFSQASWAKRVKILHFNIKELSTAKINKKHPQYMMALDIIKSHNYDFLSINEVQYDIPKVPTPDMITRGKNDSKILKDLGLKDWHTTFNQANTGNNAKKKANGEYPANNQEPKARNYADQVNFGIFPGQYSTMGLSKYTITKETVITDLKWTDFNPKADPSTFTGGDGKPLPQDMPLFDKNFTDITVNVGGKLIHVVLLHTVPSFHFGNARTPNYERNGDQLRFLEWYLTGKTEGEVGVMKNVSPLGKEARWIAMGDFNIALDTQHKGSAVLQRLKKNATIWMDDPGHTNESGGFKPSPSKLQLDYIFVSKGIQVKDAHVYGQESQWEDLGCDESQRHSPHQDRVLISYRGEQGKQCVAFVSRDYYQAKLASDHFAIYADLEL